MKSFAREDGVWSVFCRRLKIVAKWTFLDLLEDRSPSCTAERPDIRLRNPMFFTRVLLIFDLLLENDRIVRRGSAFLWIAVGVLHVAHPGFRGFKCQWTRFLLTWVRALGKDTDKRL